MPLRPPGPEDEETPKKHREGTKWKEQRKQFMEIICGQCNNTEHPGRRQRATIIKVRENPFVFRSFELIISTTIAGIFMEASLPLEGYENLALHTGICGPVIPIFALFSSSVMLDRNPNSSIVTYALLAISACLYLLTIVILAMNVPLLDMNRTKYRIALVGLSSLALLNFLLLCADLLTALSASVCNMFKCCLKPLKKEREGQREKLPAA